MAEEVTISEGQARDAGGRERSTIAFPYGDLDGGIAIARALLDYGGGQGDPNSLAAWAGHDSAKSGTFRNKVYAARDFGLIEIEKNEIRLSPLGRDILDSSGETDARANAFLAVPLYQAIYEAYEGRLLPKDAGLEHKMHTLGVAQKQVAKARQAFARSADQAGFFAFGRDRLVKPTASQSEKLSAGDGAPDGEARTPHDSASPTGRNVKKISLGSGGEVTLSLSVDLVTLSRHDRDFVFKLIDSLNDYTSDAPTGLRPEATDAVSATPRTAEQDAV